MWEVFYFNFMDSYFAAQIHMRSARSSRLSATPCGTQLAQHDGDWQINSSVLIARNGEE